MFFQESETVELKEIVTDDLKKEIIAFANTGGGKVYIGVNDRGEVIGVDAPDAAALQISNMVRDAIKPDLTMFLHYETIREQGKVLIMVDVQRGTDRPYYIAKKGLRPEGVYVRQGYSAVPASDAAIRRMIKETDGDRFEAMRSLEQSLTFQAAAHEFQLRDIAFGPAQMHTLKLIDRDGLYTNLALLLSDQCRHTIKAAVFQGTDQTIFKDRREFHGSLLQQMNEVYDFIDFRNQTRSTVDRLLRIDKRDYPEVALRETLLNLLVHRDYSLHSSSLINIYEDRIELISVGGLMPGIELEDIMAGLSICRNQDLANLFYHLHLIEAYGTGISKIIRSYQDNQKKPSFEATKNVFKMTLPNRNADAGSAVSAASAYRAPDVRIHSASDHPDTREKKILQYADVHGSITRANVMELLGVSLSTASRLLGDMTNRCLLTRNGNTRNTRYTLNTN